MFLRDAPCLFCLHPASARLGLDKKQRPYLHCVTCGARSFLPLYDCLRGPAILPALIEAWRKATPEGTQRDQLAVYLADLRRRATSPATAPPATADAALTAAMEKIA
jgi:hypothetical protein